MSAHRLAVVPLPLYRRVTRHLASSESCALSEVLGILRVQIKTRVNGKEKRANIRASNSRLTVDLGSQPSSVHLHLSYFFCRCWSRAPDQEPHSRTSCVLCTKEHTRTIKQCNTNQNLSRNEDLQIVTNTHCPAHQGILWVHIKTRVNWKNKRANSRASNSRLTVDLGSQPST